MNARNIRGATLNVVTAGLTPGTTSTYTTTATTQCVIDGAFATGLTAQTNTATPTTDATTGAGFVAQTDDTACCYVFGVTAAGAIAVSQGPIIPTEVGVTTTAGAFINPPPFPALPDNFCPIGYFIVRAAPSASAWTFGSSNWTATGMTVTAKNVFTLPGRPKTA